MLKAFVVGNITRDLELKSGTDKNNEAYKKVTLTVASNRVGEDEADFIDVEIWGGLAEACAKHLKKGSRVAVTGDLRFDSYELDGVKKIKVLIKNAEVQFL